MTTGEKVSLKNATVADLSEVLEKLKEDGLLFRWSFTKISKHLLSHFLDMPLFIGFDALRDAFLENIEFRKEKAGKKSIVNALFEEELKEEIETAIKYEDTFHKYICKTYLGLTKEPKEELLEAFVRAREDIKVIDKNLKKIADDLERIDRIGDTIEIQSRKPILIYYRGRNLKAKEDVLDFLKNNINDYALNKCYDKSILSALFERPAYNYLWNPESYVPRYPNDLENKFGTLEFPVFKELYKKYTEDKTAFYRELTNFINDQEIVHSMVTMVGTHHLLDSRKDIIEAAIAAYVSGARIMFTNAVPTIIEGIIHDLCVQVGESDNELLQMGFQEKLDKLHRHLGWELFYEYYSFRFRLFRNKVAHGRLTKLDVDELADLLLLDLHHMCRLVNSNSFKLNRKRFVIAELSNNIASPDYKYLMEYLLLDQIQVPIFYELSAKITEIDKIISSSEFWLFLESEIDQGGESVKHALYLILKTISKRKPFDKRCTKLFKKIGIRKVDTVIAERYLQYLTNAF